MTQGGVAAWRKLVKGSGWQPERRVALNGVGVMQMYACQASKCKRSKHFVPVQIKQDSWVLIPEL